MNYIEKKISINKAMAILAKNGIHVNEEETVTILDFFIFDGQILQLRSM